MNTRLTILFFVCLLSVRTTPGISQVTEIFSGVPAQYPDELYLHMQKNISPESERIIYDFMILWNDSAFSIQEQQRIINTSRYLVNKNAKPYPHFSNFLSCITTLRRSVQYETNFDGWVDGLDLMLTRPDYSLQRVDEYLGFSTVLIDSNFLYDSRSVKWKITSPFYRFVADTVVRVEISKTDLVCYFGRDSMNIFDTEGIFYPVNKSWQGRSGIVTWERAGFARENVYAQLDAYTIDMSGFEYRAEHVIFINKHYFDMPIEGKLLDQVKLNKTPEDADYPQFDTYQRDFQIHNLYEDIDYTGGLSMQGAKLIGTGNQFEQAMLYIFQQDTLRLIAKSHYFAFKAVRIDAPNAEITIRLRNDSIFHPGITFSYILSGRELTLMRTDNFTSQSPYFSSYHNIDMTFEQLSWKMNEPYMQFSALIGSTIGNATFESVNYFNNAKYLSMQGMDEVHPLVSIRSFASYMGSETFLAEDFANYLRKPVAQVKQLLMRMAVLGFVYFDTETGMVTIKQRLHDYLASSVNRVDYDAISFASRTTAPLENAILDLTTYDLRINGISRIILSESQSVAVYPTGASITMKKNRDFSFNGLVEAGLFSFMGENLFFNYDSFKIDMVKIDSLHIRYLTEQVDGYGFNRLANVNNLIQDVNGVLFIDQPENKSGRIAFAEYPVFKSEQEGFVYYDDKAIQDGVYTADRFYFKIYPFVMDSLNTFNYHTMQFDGELVSADIFPTLYETLRLHPDNSLGFLNHQAPDTGLPAYGGKGYFLNELNLNVKGLTGNGTIRYMNSEIRSDEITFYPDSVMALADDFTLTRKTTETQFPMAHSSDDNIIWYPYLDELYASRTNTGFYMFNDSVYLNGDLKLQPSGLSGWGTVSMEGAEFESDLYTFKANEIFADTVDFRLRSLHNEGFTVLADNMNARLDFSIQKGYFNANDVFTMVSFPENKYVSYLDNFEWDMQQKELAMGSLNTAAAVPSSGDEFLSGSRYISLDSKQDSISFISPVAYYDYEDNTIKATQVKYIDIADARIYPDGEVLVVNPDGRIQTLTNSAILANRETQYFNLYNATVSVSGRNNYTGSADYDYTDELDQVQVIRFKTLATDENNETIGSGEVIEPDHFTLSPNFMYQGRFFMEAGRKNLTFDGAVMIEDNCDKLSSGWLAFRSEIDPDNIFIPVGEEPADIDRNRIFNGLYMYYDSVHVYPAFLSGRKFHSDKAVVTSSGYLYYEKATQQYLIADREKLLNSNASGNILSLHRETCDLYGEGRLDLGADLGQVKLITLGNASHQMSNNSTELNVILGMDFFIEDKVIDQMAYELDSIPGLQATDLNNLIYTRSITELIGQDKFNALRSEMSLFGAVKEVPSQLRHTILFSELNLKWDDEANSWKSIGKIGIASINNTQINKRVNGLLELQVRRSGDICDLYLEIDRRTWYYFGYTRGVMQIHSSSSQLLEKIKNLKNRQRRMKIKSGESYIYMVSTDAKRNTFYRRYQEEMEAQSREESEQ
ncbi:MAG: hypothetical protein JXB19_08990 [Bacteroidales bacterium]|nr:hypothetical protein [Bacteroidales bacterium]